MDDEEENLQKLDAAAIAQTLELLRKAQTQLDHAKAVRHAQLDHAKAAHSAGFDAIAGLDERIQKLTAFVQQLSKQLAELVELHEDLAPTPANGALVRGSSKALMLPPLTGSLSVGAHLPQGSSGRLQRLHRDAFSLKKDADIVSTYLIANPRPSKLFAATVPLVARTRLHSNKPSAAPKPAGGRVWAAEDYFGPDALLASVASGAIGALRGRYIVELQRAKGKLLRRQELPARAFWSIEDSAEGPGLRTLLDGLTAKFGAEEAARRFGSLFVCLSYRCADPNSNQSSPPWSIPSAGAPPNSHGLCPPHTAGSKNEIPTLISST